MARVAVDQQKLIIKTEPREVDLAKPVPGLRWDPKAGVWTAPLSRANWLVVSHVFGRPTADVPELTTWAALEQRGLWLRERLNLDGLPEAWEPLRSIVSSDPRTKPFQQAGALFLASQQQALLADEMGSGKTLTAITALRLLWETGQDPFPTIIVAPNSVTRSWLKELDTWWPDCPVPIRVISGGIVTRRKLIAEAHGGIAIINWEGLRSHTKFGSFYGIKQVVCDECSSLKQNIKAERCERHDKELNFFSARTVIADEAHRAKSPHAQQTRALWGIGDDAEFRFAPTGTPIANNISDLWTIMRFVCRDEYPAKTRFLDRYGVISYDFWGAMEVAGINPETRDEFDQLFLPRFRRMPKAVTLPQLPEKVYEPHYLDLKGKQKTAYNQAKEDLLVDLDSGSFFPGEDVTRVIRLLQFSSAYAEINEAGQLRLSTPSNKIDELVRVVKDDLPHTPVVVFAVSRQLVELAAERLVKEHVSHKLITGAISPYDRQQAIEWFQDETNGPGILLCTIQAAGTGLTMTRAKHAIFLQRSWSMLENKQAEDRIHRIGSERHDSVVIIDFVTEDTIEEAQIDRIQAKADNLEDLVCDRDAVRRLLQ